MIVVKDKSPIWVKFRQFMPLNIKNGTQFIFFEGQHLRIFDYFLDRVDLLQDAQNGGFTILSKKMDYRVRANNLPIPDNTPWICISIDQQGVLITLTIARM